MKFSLNQIQKLILSDKRADKLVFKENAMAS